MLLVFTSFQESCECSAPYHNDMGRVMHIQIFKILNSSKKKKRNRHFCLINEIIAINQKYNSPSYSSSFLHV